MLLRTLKNVATGPLTAAMLLGLILTGLHLMNSAVQNTAELDKHFVPLLIFTVFALFALVVLVMINIIQLVVRYRQQAAGSRLTLRMVGLFVVLSTVPVSIVYFYSQRFLLHGIDSWFNVSIDQAMDDALQLSRASLSLHQRDRLKQTQRLFMELQEMDELNITLSLNNLRERYGATELLVMREQDNSIVASSNIDITNLVPERPDTSILQQTRDSGSFVTLMPQGTNGILQVRVVVSDTLSEYLLQALYPTSINVTSLTDKVQNAYNKYKELSFLRESLKSTFTRSLAMVVVFSLLAAVWVAFYVARRMVQPIADIAEGTRAVSKGEYGLQLPKPRFRDELSFLVASFNQMSRRIASARDAADRSQHELARQHAYLETVLGRLSSGVIAFDQRRRLGTANPAARTILGLSESDSELIPLHQLGEQSSRLRQLVERLEQILDSESGDWRGEIELHDSEGRQVLLCRLTPLALPERDESGHVLVFDDVTALIKAQRDAAWGGVARRLAHEIKNPLTPIQLCAERLRHKCLHQVDQEIASLLDRSTSTIIHQVEAMKQMLDTFSDYARPPRLNPVPLNLDLLIGEVVDLYRSAEDGVRLHTDLNAAEARVMADPLRMRQVLHNLIKNAREAATGRADPWVEIRSETCELKDYRQLTLFIRDNGPGFDESVLPRLFEPYVTTKTKGTGLGLAIVKKIIEEHSGVIRAVNLAEGGALISIHLPLATPLPSSAERPIVSTVAQALSATSTPAAESGAEVQSPQSHRWNLQQ